MDRDLAALMVATQGGDRAAYTALLKTCVPLITAVARRTGASMDCIDDAVQETLITLHGARHTYDPSRSFIAWLSVLAQRRAVDVLRRQGRSRSREIHAPLAYENTATTERTAEQRLEDDARRQVLREAVASLSVAQREAVRHLAIDEMSLNEAAAATSRSKGALKVNLHRALAALRARLAGSGPMTSPHTDTLIDRLTQELQPVGRLRAPAVRALMWLGLVGGVGVVMALLADRAALSRRMAIAPDMWLSVLGASATAITACTAAFQLSLPDRKARWAWLPLPAALLWIGASGAGCLRTLAAGEAGSVRHSLDCLVFVILMSAPLSAVLIVMLRRGYALRPGLVAVMGGLAAAAAAAVLLNFFHPFDAVATDLAVHAVTVGLVVAGNWAFGGRVLNARKPFASAK